MPVYLSQDLEDATLVERCRAGDPQAFEGLVHRHQRVLFNVALRILGNREDAGDATQNAFIKLYQNLDSYDEQRRFFSWAYRILRNECLNMLRARRMPEPVSEEVHASFEPVDRLEREERRRCVQAALLDLSIEQREVVVLRHFAGLSYAEVGAVLGISEKMVKSRLYSARQRLGEKLLGWRTR